ncbi:MAG: hybrid sensor histidine kinase/response regulator [bacterium]
MSATDTSDLPAKVLVIDDDLGPRESLRILLKNHYQVFCAESVDQGLELLNRHQPDVVVMDIRMPGKGGIEGLREIRAVDTTTSVVMLTGYGALETAQEAIRLGASDYLKKPFDTIEMSRVIEHNVQRTRLERRRKQVEQELKDINAKLINELAQKDHMAASVGQRSAEIAHDLRNPLTTVIGYVQLLSADLQKSRQELGDQWETTNESIKVIESSVWQCKELTDLLMNLDNGSTCPIQEVQLVELIRDVVRSLELRAAERGVKFSIAAEGPEVQTMANRLQLSRAFSNVLVNALEAVPDNTGSVNISYKREGGSAKITVQDNGCGITAEKLARVFDPYFTTKQGTGGTGLGLFVTKTVIEDLHGSIDLQSSSDKGTLVTIRLPLHETVASQL